MDFHLVQQVFLNSHLSILTANTMIQTFMIFGLNYFNGFLLNSF